jgi:hypothetical protein
MILLVVILLQISSRTSLTLVESSNPIFRVGYSCSASFLNTKTPKNCEIIQNISSRDVSDNNNIIWVECFVDLDI